MVELITTEKLEDRGWDVIEIGEIDMWVMGSIVILDGRLVGYPNAPRLVYMHDLEHLYHILTGESMVGDIHSNLN